MPPKKAAPDLPKVDSFFVPTRPVAKKPPPVPQAEPPCKRRFVYDHNTGLARAEIIGNVGVCLETGMELFTLPARQSAPMMGRRFDFTPPGGKRHPNDMWVDVQALVRHGIISDADIQSRRSFSREQLVGFMAQLEAELQEQEAMCRLAP